MIITYNQGVDNFEVALVNTYEYNDYDIEMENIFWVS